MDPRFQRLRRCRVESSPQVKAEGLFVPSLRERVLVRANLRKWFPSTLVETFLDKPNELTKPQVSTDQAEFYQKELKEMRIFAGGPAYPLATEICSQLDSKLGRAQLTRFHDGENFVRLLDNVRGKSVFIIQTAPSGLTGSDALHASLMEMLFMVTAARRASAEKITCVLPYLPYLRQNAVKTDHTSPQPSSDITKLLSCMGADRVVLVDAHNERVEGYFPESMPCVNLMPYGLAAQYLKSKELVNPVVVAPENRTLERTKLFWRILKRTVENPTMATIVHAKHEREHCEDDDEVKETDNGPGYEKVRLDAAKAASSRWVVGDVKGRDCVIIDDIIDSGTRSVNAANALKRRGARNIYLYATHGLFSKGCLDLINNSVIDEVIVTNSIPIPSQSLTDKVTVISLGKLLGETIKRLHAGEGISTLHKDVEADEERMASERRQ
ncbi:MAG: uncharacterized protein KVP18_003492 [Porospora cf. gigantea A]|uniref:uncharacterized protein n=1 Tax=Porospora cf. gigantea A TaxID=2853593 RepID=UPI00355ACC91|nr:MAG: hypothetical protein KVP18_003492 [Porospora cf. gigantea A]